VSATISSQNRFSEPVVMWWMSLPKESLTAAERATPICWTLDAAIRQKKIVSILYRPPERPQAQVLLHPAELYRREGQLYVEGKDYPAGNIRIIKINRILEARLTDPDLTHSRSSQRLSHARNKNRRGAADRSRFVLLELLVLLVCVIIHSLQQLNGPAIIF